MNKNLFLAILVVSMIPGLFSIGRGIHDLAGSGITGNIILDENTGEVCQSDADCSQSEVCCLFDGEDAGACGQESRCSEISRITGSREAVMQQPAPTQTSPGIVLYFVIALSLFVVASVHTAGLFLKHSGHDAPKHDVKPIKQKKIESKPIRTAKSTIKHTHSKIASIASHISFKMDDKKTEKYIVMIVGIVAIIAIIMMLI